MQPNAPLPSFLTSQPAAQPQRLRLLDAPAPAAAPAPMARDAYRPTNNQVGQMTLSTVTTGLGVAGVFAPPVLPIAGLVGGVQLLDAQLGGHLTAGVGAATRFVGNVGETVIDGVGSFFGGLFGGKKKP